MSSVTITLTEAPRTLLQSVMSEPRPTTPETQPHALASKVKHLDRMLKQFKDYKDPLSNRLRNWGEGVLQIVHTHRTSSPERIANIAQERISVLAEILVNPLDGAPLKDPRLMRGWTWEKHMHDDCRRLFKKVSGLDGGVMEVNPDVHLFARAMIRFRDGFPITESQSERKSQSGQTVEETALVPQDLSLSGKRPFKYPPAFYQSLMKMAVAQRHLEMLQEDMDSTVVSMDESLAEIRERSREELENVEAAVAYHEAELQRRLSSIHETHNSQVTEILAQLDVLQQSYTRNIAALEERLETANARNDAEAETLMAQVAAMHQEHQTTIAALGGRLDQLNQNHAQEVVQVETQFNTAIQAQQATIASIREEQRQTTFHLQGLVQQSHQSVQIMHSSLTTANTQNAHNQSVIGQLHSRISSLEGQLGGLQYQASRRREVCTIS